MKKSKTVQIIATERLYLREFRLDDASNLFKINADPDVMRYTGDPPFESKAAARVFLQHYDSYRKMGYGRWAVIQKADDRFIGWCGLKFNELEQVDLGYRFFKAEWGKGYATEAAKAVADYAFSTLEMPGLIARVAAENPASTKVLEKIGFSFWKEDSCKGIPNSQYFKLTAP